MRVSYHFLGSDETWAFGPPLQERAAEHKAP